MFSRHSSNEASSPSWVSFTEMSQSISGASWIRFKARM